MQRHSDLPQSYGQVFRRALRLRRFAAFALQSLSRGAR
jgi:hypothetical protein